MKITLRFITPIIMVVLIAACGSQNNESKAENSGSNEKAQVQTEQDDGDTNEIDKDDQEAVEQDDQEAVEQDDSEPEAEKSMTQAEVMKAIKQQINTDLPLELPDKLPLEKGKHLTAVTKSDVNSYEVVFYESDEPIPINNEKLKSDDNAAAAIATIHVQKYDSQKQADEQISFDKYDENGGQEIDLGHGITGYQDAGAGSAYTGWNEGRWALATHMQTSEGDQGTDLAKDAVAYLEENTLPIPKPHGYAHLDVDKKDNRILWEKDTTVYTIDQVKDPMNALKIAVNF
jgi:hypothetical protein